MIENQVLEALATTLVERMEKLLTQRMHFEIAIKLILESEDVRGHHLEPEEVRRLEGSIRGSCVTKAMERARKSSESGLATGKVSGRIPPHSTKESRLHCFAGKDLAAGAGVEDRRDKREES